jgi:hypothetical protein
MAEATDWTVLDDLIGLRRWLQNSSDAALALAVPAATQSRSEVLAALNDLIEMQSRPKKSHRKGRK